MPRLLGGPRQHLQHQRRPRVGRPALAGAPALPSAPGRLLLRHRAVRRVVDRPRPLRRRRRDRQVPLQECPSNCRSVIIHKICLAASCLARRRQDSEASQRGRALDAEQLSRDIASMLHAGRLTFQLVGMPSAQAVGRAAAGQPDHDSAAQHPQAAAGARCAQGAWLQAVSQCLLCTCIWKDHLMPGCAVRRCMLHSRAAVVVGASLGRQS